MAKNKGGRPEKRLSEKALAQISELAGRGWTLKQIAEMKEMAVETLTKYGREAWQKGKYQADDYVKKRLFDLIKEGDRASIFFYLKTQCGYTETQRIETDVNVQHVISSKPLTANEWALEHTGQPLEVDYEELKDDE
jgi:hypothetical protein